MTWGMVLRFSAIVTAAVVLSACEGIKEQLGQTKQAPDEFRVVSRAPLSLPPDFSLRPPEPGVARPQEGTTAQQARKVVFRADEPKVAPVLVPRDGRSVGELALLRSAGAETADPNIRTVVERETLSLNAESEGFIDTLIFWRDKQEPGVIVDARSEAERLRENAALGKEATSGATPTVERTSRALFEGIF
jgi:Protein of unknown function (DUF3035)